jgi:hypothetical protein
MYFSYSQFHVFDSSVKLPGCAWTDKHYQQGFARRDHNVNFGTILEFGHAELSVNFEAYRHVERHERVIEVPFEVVSGSVTIGGPEEYPNDRVISAPRGYYRLTAAQTTLDDERETIELYFERLPNPLRISRIVLADDQLCPSDPLLEVAEIA